MNMPVLVAYPRKSSVFISLFFGGTVFLASSALLVAAAVTKAFDGDLGVRLFAVLMCANPAFFTGLLVVRSLKRLDFSRPDIVIDDAGVMFRLWSSTPIPWSNIDRVGQRALGFEHFSILWLRDIAISPATSVFAKLRARLRPNLDLGHVLITANGTTATNGEIAKALAAQIDHESVPQRI